MRPVASRFSTSPWPTRLGSRPIATEALDLVEQVGRIDLPGLQRLDGELQRPLQVAELVFVSSTRTVNAATSDGEVAIGRPGLEHRRRLDVLGPAEMGQRHRPADHGGTLLDRRLGGLDRLRCRLVGLGQDLLRFGDLCHQRVRQPLHRRRELLGITSLDRVPRAADTWNWLSCWYCASPLTWSSLPTGVWR